LVDFGGLFFFFWYKGFELKVLSFLGR
jgi:hypothetical protein